MIRRLVLAVAAALLVASPVAAAGLHLARVVLVVRHGIRPPIPTNAQLAKFSDKPWPDWPVAPGELTPHGGDTVKLAAATIGQTYRRLGVLPAHGCAAPGEVAVWADNADERTRDTGRIFAAAVEPGCGIEARWSGASSRDPIFSGAGKGACPLDPAKVKAGLEDAASDPLVTAPQRPALARLQAIIAPKACDGGAGLCFDKPAAPGAAGSFASFFPPAAALSEDLMLEYVDGKPMSQVGWGRATRADIFTVMPLHERAFAFIRDDAYMARRGGAPMARVILAALAGEPVGGGPQSGPGVRLLALSGHDTNLAWMSGVFGVRWSLLPSEPSFVAPSTTLAFELWSDGHRRYVRPVIYFETLDQLRTLKPALARSKPLRFAGCASGPMGSCPLAELRRLVEARLPAGCGLSQAAAAPRPPVADR